MKFFSLFSGVGGFEIGINDAYANLRSTRKNEEADSLENILPDIEGKCTREPTTCIGFSEIDKYASAVLRYRFPNTTNYGDITKIDWSAVPDFDLLVGGSPCQDLSVAGKQKGLVGERSGLFYEYVKALEVKKPSNFIWENVKGALSSNGGRDFATILNAFSEEGYSLTWQVLNAKDFGVPQNRERVFVVGTRNGSGREVFFERGVGKENTVASDTASIYKQTERLSDAFRIRGTDGVSATLKGLGGGMGAKTGLYAIRQPLRFLERNQRNIDGDYAFTVDAGQTSGIKMGDRIRRLTPRECERLMSWSDDWTRYGDFDGVVKEISDSQRYKMCGNGVVSNVVRSVVESASPSA